MLCLCKIKSKALRSTETLGGVKQNPSPRPPFGPCPFLLFTLRLTLKPADCPGPANILLPPNAQRGILELTRFLAQANELRMLSTQTLGFDGACGAGCCWVAEEVVYLSPSPGFRTAQSPGSARGRSPRRQGAGAGLRRGAPPRAAGPRPRQRCGSRSGARSGSRGSGGGGGGSGRGAGRGSARGGAGGQHCGPAARAAPVAPAAPARCSCSVPAGARGPHCRPARPMPRAAAPSAGARGAAAAVRWGRPREAAGPAAGAGSGGAARRA